MTEQQDSQFDKSEFENYKLWLDRIREERGTHGVAEATFRLYIENRRLRAELQRVRAPSLSTLVKPVSTQLTRPISAGRAVQLAQGQRTREAIYSFLQSYITDNGRSPSQREIAAAVGVTPAIVTRHLNRLERDGKIVREPGVERSIRLS